MSAVAHRRRYEEAHPAVAAKAGDWRIFTVGLPPAVSAEFWRSSAAILEQAMRGIAVHAYYNAPELWAFGTLRPTAKTATHQAPVERLPGLERLERAAKAFPAEELNGAAYAEAVKLLDIIGAAAVDNVPVPDIGVSDDEISLSWARGDHIVLVSVEGDGEAAYTYHVAGKFQPGREAFMLEGERLPADLREYLRAMYA